MIKLLFTLFVALFAQFSHVARAFEGDGRNPGTWKAIPVTFSNAETDNVIKMSLFNPESFSRKCTFGVRFSEGSEVGVRELVLYPGRRLDSQFSLPAALKFESLQAFLEAAELDMACYKLSENDNPLQVPDPALTCALHGDGCGQLCLASESDSHTCKNDHLLVSYKRNDLSVKNDMVAKRYEFSVKLFSKADEPLACQLMLPLLLIDPANPGRTMRHFLINPPLLLQSKQAIGVNFLLNHDEIPEWFAPSQNNLRVLGVCAVAEELSEAHDALIQRCMPNRNECNWVSPQ